MAVNSESGRRGR